jgi:hypothetical protein
MSRVQLALNVDDIDATRRLSADGLPTGVEEGITCCYALQDKVWVTGPGGERWVVYTVLADAADAPTSGRGGDRHGRLLRAGVLREL